LRRNPIQAGAKRTKEEAKLYQGSDGMSFMMGWIFDNLARGKCKREGHVWRPGMTSMGPSKYCDRCELIVRITKEEYYAQFGTIPHIL
jgi:Na+-transporting NADH:ubiquinone oxidoreductase subunit NqrF